MRIFISNSLRQGKALKYNLSIAASNFSYNLIEGGVFDKVYTVLPAFVGRDAKDMSADGLIYSSWRRNRVLRRFAPIAENVKLWCKIPRRSNIWLYNVTALNTLLIVLLRLFKPSVSVYAILLDYTPTRRKFSLDSFMLWLANHADGTICLADSALFTCRNTACLPGVVPVSVPEYAKITMIEKSFLLSGVLSNNISMLTMLLPAFSRMPEMTLHITGSIPANIDIDSWASRYKNIVYHGRVSFEDYNHLLDKVSFVLSTRNPNYPENRCNFPSKIMEALLHNRIVISTLHYSQLDSVRYFEAPTDETRFINLLRHIVSLPSATLLQYANQSDLVKQKFNSSVWLNTMQLIERNTYARK